jgi:Fe-S-cluster containining protein
MARHPVVRPVVRAFQAQFEADAAAHVRSGGHAIVWTSPRRARLVFRPPRGAENLDLGYWALLDMGRTEWSRVKRGALRGLAIAPVPRDCVDLVKARAERDSIHRESTRRMLLDCETCAACCRDNRVELETRDIDRFARANRPELARPPYTRRDGKKVVLRLLRSRDCRHLGADRRCGIYEIRPESCRVFPPGSEGCLYSRDVELGIVDGARDEKE